MQMVNRQVPPFKQKLEDNEQSDEAADSTSITSRLRLGMGGKEGIVTNPLFLVVMGGRVGNVWRGIVGNVWRDTVGTGGSVGNWP